MHFHILEIPGLADKVYYFWWTDKQCQEGTSNANYALVFLILVFLSSSLRLNSLSYDSWSDETAWQEDIIMFIFSVAIQSYRVDVFVAQVILGNDVLIKCDIPSFVADFVFVASWVDSEGLTISVNKNYGNW